MPVDDYEFIMNGALTGCTSTGREMKWAGVWMFYQEHSSLALNLCPQVFSQCQEFYWVQDK